MVNSQQACEKVVMIPMQMDGPHYAIADGGSGSGSGSDEVGEEARVNGGSRTSELTISFEGEVYVFPAVTPQKVPFLFISLLNSLIYVSRNCWSAF